MTWDERILNDGNRIPSIAFGTAYTAKADVDSRIRSAIKAGFRHFDTAEGKAYDNEKELGDALRSTPRSDLFIATKWSNFEEGGPIENCERSLRALGVDYVDLYLIHQTRNCRGDIPGTWRQMEEIRRRGLARSIGVSNFDVESLETLLSDCDIPPAVNQIYLNPNNIKATEPLLALAHEHDIAIEAYWLLRILTDEGEDLQPAAETARRIAEERSIEPDHVLLAWAKAKGVIPITSSSKLDRLAGYMGVSLQLSDGEIAQLDEAGSRAHGSLPWGKG